MGAEPTYGVLPCPTDAPLFRHQYDPFNRGYIIPAGTLTLVNGVITFPNANGLVLTTDNTSPYGYSWQAGGGSGGGGSGGSGNTYAALALASVTLTAGTDALYEYMTGAVAAPMVITLDIGAAATGRFEFGLVNVTTTAINSITFRSSNPTTLLVLNDAMTQSGNLTFVYSGADWVLFQTQLY